MDLPEYQGKQLFKKHAALEAKGVRVARNPTQVAEIANEMLVSRV
jgi:succinyl-CoA synthetase beta subunit